MIDRIRKGLLPYLCAAVMGLAGSVAITIAVPAWNMAEAGGGSSDSSSDSSSSDSSSSDSSDDSGSSDDSVDLSSSDAPIPAGPRAAPPPPAQAPDEIVIGGLDRTALRILEDRGFVLIAGGPLPAPRALLKIPAGLTVPEALAIAAGLSKGSVVPNTYYRTQAVPVDCVGAICLDWAEVGWPPSPPAACLFSPHIGIDTGVNRDHDMLASADITVETIGATGAAPSEARHGTAIVAMFAGDPAGRVPGLAPAARILVVDPFGTADGEERADVFGLVQALERLIEAGVDVISMSLAGNGNALLEEAVVAAQAAGIPVVAAVGNAGPAAAPLYPAGYPGVVAVTAVDRNGVVYRRAVQGSHVTLSAPGVEVVTAASISGVRPQTGTSFAVPFVTTAVAAALAIGHSADLLAYLGAGATDLGEPGRDPVFGWGLVQIPSPCLAP
ncbi:MAG: S8 family serine peptidase [Bauldia sp.]|nr:S8 family serine peptidase [Bauldia sp.]